MIPHVVPVRVLPVKTLVAEVTFVQPLPVCPHVPQQHEAAGELLGRLVRRDPRELTVDVQCALQLQEVPVVLDHLGGGTVLAMPHDDVVEEDDLGELHGHVVLIGARSKVRDHGGTDAERGNGDSAKCSKDNNG